ncbi:MAG TPA: preprotein translocase subunit YajC [Bryobacteraceae bacterium]|nr:preprotein translocase subunit YajC [Bryobacteraceae bacterium]
MMVLALLQQSGPSSLIAQVLPLVLILAIFYVLVFMPMQKQRRQQAQMLRELKNGQMVLTTGGIVGSIVSINEDDTLILRVKPDNIKIQVARSAVASLVTAEEKKT